MVTPGDGGIEIADEVCGESRGESFARELGGEAGREVLKHDKADEESVAGGPRGWLIAEQTEFEGQVRVLEGDGGVDAGGVALELVELLGWECGEGAIGGVADLKGSLETIVRQKRWAEDLGEVAGGVAAERIHLPEAILGGDEALGEEKVIERGCADVGDAVSVALNGDGSGEAGKSDGAIEVRE